MFFNFETIVLHFYQYQKQTEIICIYLICIVCYNNNVNQKKWGDELDSNLNHSEKSTIISSLQALRGIAFLGIASFHCGLSLFGSWSVSVFFMLSGFLTMRSNMNKTFQCSFKNNIVFSLKRIAKLYPMYVITTIAMIFIHNSFSPKIIAINLFLVQSWIPDSNIFYSLNGVAWFFSDLLFIYMIFPIIGKVIQKYKSKKTAIIVSCVILFVLACVSLFARVLNGQNESLSEFCKWIGYVCPVTRLGDFAVGCNLYYIFDNSKKEMSSTKATVYEILAILVTGISQVLFYFNAKKEIQDSMLYLYIPVSMLCVYLFTVKRGFFTGILSNKLLIGIGDLSNYAFLLHRPTMDLLYGVIKSGGLNHRVYDIIIFTLSTLIALLLSWLYSKLRVYIKKKT